MFLPWTTGDESWSHFLALGDPFSSDSTWWELGLRAPLGWFIGLQSHTSLKPTCHSNDFSALFTGAFKSLYSIDIIFMCRDTLAWLAWAWCLVTDRHTDTNDETRGRDWMELESWHLAIVKSLQSGTNFICFLTESFHQYGELFMADKLRQMRARYVCSLLSVLFPYF